MTNKNLTLKNFPSIADVDANGNIIGLSVGNVVVTNNLELVGDAISRLGDVSTIRIYGGNAGEYLQTDGTGNLSWANSGGGGGLPAGANTQVQFNDDGVFGADSDLTYDKTTGTLAATTLSGNLANGNSSISIPSAGGNINISAAGGASEITVTSTGVNVSGYLTASGNIRTTGGFINGPASLRVGNSSAIVYVEGTTQTWLGTDTGGVYSNSNVELYGNLRVAGQVDSDLIPSYDVGNGVIHNLGSNANRWGELWLTGNTIYLGNATISANGNSLVMPPIQSISFSSPANMTIGGGTAGQVLSTDGAGNLSWQNDRAPLPIANGNSNINIASVNGNITLNANGNVTTFATNGQLTIPGGIVSNTNIFGVLNQTAVGMIAGPVNVDIGDQANASFLRINLGEVANNYNGIKGDVELLTNVNELPLAPASIYIAPQLAYRWKFSGSDGVLTVPGNIVGSGASPAPSISGFSSISVVDGANLANVTFSAGNITVANVITANSITLNNTSIRLGNAAGATDAGIDLIAIGNSAATQGGGNYAISIGSNAGYYGANVTGDGTVAIGNWAGYWDQDSYAIAIGSFAGAYYQDQEAIAIGRFAGSGLNGNAASGQSNSAIAIGQRAGSISQGVYSIAIGANAGRNISLSQGQPNNSIVLNATGVDLTTTQSNSFTVKPVRNAAGTTPLYYDSVTGEITHSASGNITVNSVTLTNGAILKDTVDNSVSLGNNAGTTSQGQAAVAIGMGAGSNAQAIGAVAVGLNAGSNTQGAYTVAVGIGAGRDQQGDSTVAIGGEAGGNSQGANSVAIGYRAGRTNQASNSIVINATGANLDTTTANSLVIKPIRDFAGSVPLYYNSATGEITYSNTGTLSVSTITATGNITSTGGDLVAQEWSAANTANVANFYSNGGLNIYATAGFNVFGAGIVSNGVVNASGNITASNAAIVARRFITSANGIVNSGSGTNLTLDWTASLQYFTPTNATNIQVNAPPVAGLTVCLVLRMPSSSYNVAINGINANQTSSGSTSFSPGTQKACHLIFRSFGTAATDVFCQIDSTA